MAQTRQHLWTNSQVDEIREQRDQLMEAKRAALKLADERSKENCALRQENERLRARPDVDTLAKIIDPEAFGLPDNVGDEGDRDAARTRARLILGALEQKGDEK